MRKLRNKLANSILSAKFAAKSFLTEERGDTNFISIAIILVIVLVLAATFIIFGQRLMPALEEKVQDILTKLGI